MLGFHSDGMRLYGASDTLQAQLKKRKLPISTKISGNTLVFAIDDFEIVQKRPYHISFAADTTPCFICTLQKNCQPQFPLTLSFSGEHDLLEMMTALYYASQEFLHLDIELSFLKQTLSQDKNKVIRAFSEAEFSQLPKDSHIICFYFGNGGFLETDRIFSTLTQTHGLDMGNITLAGSFASRKSLLVAFALCPIEA